MRKLAQLVVFSLGALLVASGSPPRVMADAPTAVLTSCKGPVSIVRAGAAAASATFGMALNDGDEVKTGPGAEAEIMFASGNWVQVGANSSMRIKGSRTTPAAKSAPAKSGNAPAPAGSSASTASHEGSFEVVQNFLKLKNSEGSSSVSGLRSGEKASALTAISPAQTRVRGATPTFKWSAADASTELRLTVYNDKGVHYQKDVSGVTSFTYPADAPALAPGISYSWTLETTDPLVSPPLRTPAAYFETITPADASALDTRLASVDEQAPRPGEVSYRLMRASLYFDSGLVDDAIGETEAAVAADPDNATLHAILGRLYAQTGRTREAMAAMEKSRS